MVRIQSDGLMTPPVIPADDSTGAEDANRRVLAALAALVLRDSTRWASAASLLEEHRVSDPWPRWARLHGVSELIASAWDGPPSAAPPFGRPASAFDSLLATCRASLRAGAVFEMLRRHELRRVLAELQSGGVEPLILKGSALAYDLYASPELRPRSDTDLLLPPGSEAAAARALTTLGYACHLRDSTEQISTQSTWSFTDQLGTTHHLDIHRKANNSPLLAQAFDFKRLCADAHAIPALGPHAWGLGDNDALLLACVHRAGHADTPYIVDDKAHFGGDRLIWFYDMHLLMQRMSEPSFSDFLERARGARMAAVCHDALSLCVELFHTTVPDGFMDKLRRAGVSEPSAVFLHGNRWRRAWQEWLALPNWRDKLRWGAELAFPSARHMRAKYPESSDSPLVWLYVRRALGGLAKWSRKRRMS